MTWEEKWNVFAELSIRQQKYVDKVFKSSIKKKIRFQQHYKKR